MTGGQCLCRIILLIFFVSVSCVISDEEPNVINEELSIHSEEYERRSKIVNSYLSDYYESKKNWVETYHHNYASNRAKDIKESLNTKKDTIDEIKDAFTEHEGENPDVRLLKYEMNLVETFTDFFKNDSNSVSDFHPETPNLQNIKTLPNGPEEIVVESESSESVNTEIVKEAQNMEKVQTLHNVKIDQNSKHVIANMEIMNTKSDSPQPIETGEILNASSNIKKVQAPNDETVQIVISGKKVEIKKTDYLQLVEARNILNQLDDLKEVQTFDNIVTNQNFKLISNDGEDKLTKNVSPPPVKANKISNNSPNLGKIHKLDETVIKDKFPADDELLKRHKIVNSYLSQFDSTNDWVETYVHNYNPQKTKDSPFHSLSSFHQKSNSGIEEETAENKYDGNFFSNLYDRDSNFHQFYISRWLKKLLNKFHDAEYKSITFSLDTESIDNMKKLTEDFDIVSVDEFFCSLISNATVNHSFSWFSYDSSYSPVILLFLVMIFVFIYMRHRPIIFFLFAIIFLCFVLQANKRYETSIAKKQAVVSSVPPSYCESFVTENSGLIDITKDIFRKYWYHEDCKKYYEAIMVNPVYDINPPVVIMEVLVDTVFQIFRSFAHLSNYFIKEILYDTSLIHQVFIIIGFISLLLICLFIIILCFNYKIRLPFFFGSLEPTFAPVGSQVQDLNIPKGVFSNTSAVCNQNDKTDFSKNDTELTKIQKDQIGNVSETISTKPIVCMNIHKYICMKTCQSEKMCSDKVVSISESDRQPSSSPKSPIKSGENCIYDLPNVCGKNIPEPSFYVHNINELTSDKEIDCEEVAINSDDSKRHSSNSAKSPIKSRKEYICHPGSIPAEKVSDHSDVDSKTTCSDKSTMCSESSHLENIKPN